MTTTTRFWGTWAVFTAAGLTYPAAVAARLSGKLDEGLRWIQNDPAFNVFVPFVLPLAAALFVVSVDLKPLRTLSPGRRLSSLLVGVGLTFIALMAVASTLDRPLLEPFLFEKTGRAVQQETSIRQEIQSLRDAGSQDERIETKRSAGVDAYLQAFGPFNSLSDMATRGSFCAWLALGLNLLAAIVAVLVFWYLWNLVVFRRQFPETDHDWIPLVLGLLVLWFPIRLYSEWYIGFYSLTWMKDYPVFLFLFVVAIAGYAFCVFRLARSLGVKVFSIIGTGLVTLFGLTARINSSWLGWAAEQIEGMDFRWFAASISILTITLSAMVFSFVDPPDRGTSRRTRKKKAKKPPSKPKI